MNATSLIRIANSQRALIVWTLATLLCCSSVFAVTPAEEFATANKLYSEGRFSQAAEGYEAMVRKGPVNATLWFNLGNAYFKAGQTGRAIAAYRHAEVLAPRDPDIKANLQLARNRVSGNDSIRAPAWQQMLKTLRLNEWAALASAAFWAWLIVLAMREWKPALGRSTHTVTLALGLATVFLGCCTFSAWILRSQHCAVVSAKEAAIKTGPLDESQAAFTAKDGTELAILDQREGWLQVTDTHGRIGWLERAAAQVL